MTRIPYAESNGRLTVEVKLSHAADVSLVDQNNFRKYQAGQSYKRYGGYYTKSPVRISIQDSGRWYLIVNGSNYQYRFY